MTFWTNDELRKAFAGGVVQPYDEANIQQAAYELGVADEYAITTPDGEGERKRVPEGEDIVVPAGQFALLLTKEIVRIPPNAMGFISVKASWKLKGLVNVSGFHVDPGFHGRLRFAVYNASGKTLRMRPARPLFQLWLNRLVEPLPEQSLYANRHAPEAGIQDDEVTAIGGMVASPAGLSTRIDGLGDRLTAEMPKLEAAITKTITDKHHELALQIEAESKELAVGLARVRTWQTAQWFAIALLFTALVAEPLKGCRKSERDERNSPAPRATPSVAPPTLDAPAALVPDAMVPRPTNAPPSSDALP